MKINELASLENIQKVIKDEGLVYNNDKIKNIDQEAIWNIMLK